MYSLKGKGFFLLHLLTEKLYLVKIDINMKFNRLFKVLILLIFSPLFSLNAQTVWNTPAGNINYLANDGGAITIFDQEISKVDRAGDTLWTNYIDTSYQFTVWNMEEDTLTGDLYLGGNSIPEFDQFSDDGAVLKLNACGEEQWFKVYDYPGFMGTSVKDMIIKDGRLMLLQYSVFDDYGMQRVTLSSLDSVGNEVWKEKYFHTTEYEYGIICDNYEVEFIPCLDGGYLMTGVKSTASYPDTIGQSGYNSFHTYLVKVDSLGQLIWDNVLNWEADTLGQSDESYKAGSSIQFADGSFLICNGSRNGDDIGTVFKISNTGTLESVQTIYQDTVNVYAQLQNLNLKLLNDSIAVLISNIAYTASPEIMIIQFDTLGNIVDSTMNLGTDGSNTGPLELATNNRMLLGGIDSNNVNIVYKVNVEDYSFENHVVNDTNNYDPFCVDGIVVPLSLEEEMENVSSSALFEIVPNPAKNFIQLKVDMATESQLTIFDISGNEILNQDLEFGMTSYQLDVSRLLTGLYIVELRGKGKVVHREKLLIQ